MSEVITFPGSIAVIAAIVLVLAAFSAAVFTVIDYVARALSRT